MGASPSYDPNRMAFIMKPELRQRFYVWMAKGGYGVKRQADAMNDLIEKALASEGF